MIGRWQMMMMEMECSKRRAAMQYEADKQRILRQSKGRRPAGRLPVSILNLERLWLRFITR